MSLLAKSSLFQSLRGFAHEHDDLPAFHAAYIVLALIAAAMFNLGFFALLVVLHMALDIVKYREVYRYSWGSTLQGALRESLVDITLVGLGFAVAIYLHPSITTIANIRGVMLAELTIIRGIGLLIPKLKILFDALKILSHFEHYMTRINPMIGRSLSLLERVCVISLLIVFVLLLLAPHLLHLTDGQLAAMMLDELIPWKF